MKHRVSLSFVLMVSALFLLTSFTSINGKTKKTSATDTTQICGGKIVQKITVEYPEASGVFRDVLVYLPPTYQQGTPAPLLFALHGGSGNARQMCSPNKGILEYADDEGVIAVLPNGLSLDPSNNAELYWADPINIPYMGELITQMEGTYTVDSSSIYFIGYSGGAKLIYELASDPAISARITAIATVAGEIGARKVETSSANKTNASGETKAATTESPAWRIIDPGISGGVPMSALLLQGGLDNSVPINGGFNSRFNEILVSFPVKVDIWRNFISASIEGQRITPSYMPQRLIATRYINSTTRHNVVSIVDPQLGHAWPSDWNYMDAVKDFFERSPKR